MISRTALLLCLLSLVQHACSFSSLDLPVVNQRSTHSNNSKFDFQGALTLRGGEVVSEQQSPTSKTKQMAGISALLMAGAQSYSKYLESNPIATKSVTACLIFAASDTLAQMIDGNKKRDLKRTFAASLVGLFYFGPAAHFWYGNIFRLFPGTTLVSILQKAAMGQMFFGPSFTCIFFASALIQSGSFSLGNWFQKIKQDLFGAWVAGIGFWPLVDLISYGLVPPRYIPLFVNVCSLVWNIYLSTVANRQAKTNTA